MTIRKFDPKDSEKVKELILKILTDEYPFDKKAFSGSDLSNIHEAYSGKRDAFFVIEESGSIVGTIAIKEEGPDTALVRRFFVKGAARGRGYGKGLMDEATSYCRANRYKHLLFQGTNRMIQAIELCKKKGFKERESVDMGGFSIYKFILDL
jgi:GNAT superfamily N-acetyltransferase